MVTSAEFATYTRTTITGTSASETLRGTRGPDVVDSGEGYDRINGGSGRDLLRGGGGDDLVWGDSGDDTLEDPAGSNYLSGGAGNDQITGKGFLDGGSGDDRLLGNGYLSGGSGDDALSGSGILDGGSGNDHYSVTADATIVLAPGSGDDVIVSGWAARGLQVRVEALPDAVELSGAAVDGVATTLRLRLKASGDALAGLTFDSPVHFADGTIWQRADLVAHTVWRLPAATAEDDLLPGSPDADALAGENGNDLLAGGAGDDTLAGGGGSDRLLGGEGDDHLDGGAENDTLDGGTGFNRLFAGDGDDALLANGRGDTLDGGAGDDTHTLAAGTHTLRFGRGSGADTVVWRTEARPLASLRVELSADLTAGDLHLTRSGDALQVGVAGSEDRLTLSAWFAEAANPPSVALHFADGSVWDNDALTARLPPASAGTGDARDDVLLGDARANLLDGAAGNDRLDGRGGDDTLLGGRDDDTLLGGDGDDRLIGGNGVDRFDGGAGDDWLDTRDPDAPDNADVIVFARGSGADTVWASDAADVIALAADLTPDDVHAQISGQDLVLRLAGAPDTLRLVDGVHARGRPRTLRLADGSEHALNTRITFGRGSGSATLSSDEIGDTLLLGDNVRREQLLIAAGDNDLVLQLRGSDDSLYLRDWLARDERVATLRFADGTTHTLVAPPPQVTIGSNGTDYLLEHEASPFNDRIEGLGDDDVLYGGEGSDTLKGGDGDDFLTGDLGAGNPSTRFADVLDGGAGDDRYEFDALDTLIFGFDSGHDTFVDFVSDPARRAPGTVRFENNVAPRDVVLQLEYLSADSGLLSLALRGSNATLGRFFVDINDSSGLPYLNTRFVFGDGLIVAGDEVFARFYHASASAGNDTLLGGANSEFFDAGAAHDGVFAGPGDDSVLGGDGNDTLVGGPGNDALGGGKGNDVLSGGTGDDVLIGGPDSDVLEGGAGADSYRFDGAFGHDWVRRGVDAADGEDVIEFGEEIAPGDVTVRIDEFGTLDLSVAALASSIRIVGGWQSERGGGSGRLTLAEIRFADGTRWGTAEVAARRLPPADDRASELSGSVGADAIAAGAGNDTVFGAAGDDVLSGDEGDDRLEGGAGSDHLDGGSGNDLLAGGDASDRLTGGVGDDLLAGGDGSDVYRFSRGDGHDVVWDVGFNANDVDTLEFAPGITLADVLASRVDGQWLLEIAGSDDRITVVTGDGASPTGIERVRFADGTVIDAHTWTTRERAITWSGGSGEQALPLAAHLETLVVGAGIDPDALSLTRQGDDLVATAGSDSLRLLDWFTDPVTQNVDQLRFADGTRWTAAEMSRRATALTGSSGDDLLSASGTMFTTRIVAGDGNDRLIGGSGDDELFGDAGDDRLDGGPGADRLAGGTGDDVYFADTLDTVVEATGGGNDTLHLWARSDVVLAPHLEHLAAIGDAAIAIQGNAADNRLRGTSAANRIEGGLGNDTLDGGGGADTLVGGVGDDTYVVDNAADTLVEAAGEGNDTVQSSLSHALSAAADIENIVLTGAANLYAFGDGRANRLLGNAGNNVLRGDAGADTLDGGAGADLLEGGSGDDTYFVDSAFDRISEAADGGVDRVFAVSSTTLPSNVEVLTLTGEAAIDATGNAAANTLTGNAAANRLSGGAGDDTLDGGAGNDTLDGGAGDDRFLFARGGGQDVLIDDAASAADTLALGAGVAPADLIVRRNGDDLIVSLRATSDRLTIRGYWHAASTIETIAFADGTRWSPSDVAAAATANTPPVAHTLPSDQVANVGQPFRLDLSTAFADPDPGDVLIPLVTLADGTPLPGWLQFDPASWTLGGTPGAGDAGALDLRLTASDSGGATLATTLALAVRNPNDTSPERHTPLPDLALRQGEVLAFTVPAETFIDPDPGDRLTLTATRADGQRLPSWLTFDSLTRTLSGTPGFADVGAVDLAITATDTRGRSARDVLTVKVADVNDAPRVRTLLPDVITFQGHAIEARIPSDLFVDPEGDAFSTAVTQSDGSPLPDWLHFDPGSGRLSGVAPAVGVTSLQVRATDVLGASSAEDFDIVAGYVNQPPRLDRPLAALGAREGERVNVALPSDLFVDPDADDTLSYGLQVLEHPLHAKSDFMLSSTDGTLSLQQVRNSGQFVYGTGLDYWDIGRWTFRLTAEDPLGQRASTDFALTVEAADVNHLPVVPWSAATPWSVPPAKYLGSGRIQWEHASKQQIVHSLADGVVVDLPTFVDVDRDPLTYSLLPAVAEQSAHWSYDDSTRTLRYIGVAPAPRKASFVVVADDGRGGRSQTSLGILVNHAPKFAELPEIVIQEGEEVTITLPADVVSDADGDSIELSADYPLTAFDPLTSKGSVWAQFDPLTRQIHLTPGDFAVGSHVMTLKAEDDLANDLYEPDADANKWVPIPQQSLRITVLNTYDPPVLLTPLADRAVEEGGSITISTAPAFLKVDPGQTLSYRATLANGEPLPSWLHLDPTTGILSGRPQETDVGRFSLRVVASDPVGGSVADTFELVVNPGPGNHAPRLAAPLVDQIYRPGQSFNFQIPGDRFSDPDADTLSFTVRQENGQALPDWLHFDSATLTFSGEVPAGQRAPLEIRVEASDPQGATVAGVFSLGLILDVAPPRLGEPAADQWVSEDSTFAYELPADEFVADPADPGLSLSATLADGQALPAWLQFDPALRRFSGIPGNDDVGTLAIRVSARNAAGATADDTFLLRVDNRNDAPVAVTALPDQEVSEDQPFAFALPPTAFADVDRGDTLTLSARLAGDTPLPDWLHFDPAAGCFTGQPTNAEVGDHTVQMTATDVAGAQAAQTFVLSVANTNDAPQVTGSVPSQRALEDQAFTYALPSDLFRDVDAGEVLTLAATTTDGSALPDWLSFDAATGTFRGTPANADVGTPSIQVTATDRSGARASVVFPLSVDNVNQAPEVTGEQLSTAEDTPLRLAPSALLANDRDLDPTADVLTIASVTDARHGTISRDGDTLVFVPDLNYHGDAGFSYVVSDGQGGLTTGVVAVDVLPVNDAPLAGAALSPQSTRSGAAFFYALPADAFTDVDRDDALSYRATLSDGSALPSWLHFDAATRAFSGTPAVAGDLALTVTASDRVGASARQSFLLTVAAGNTPPLVNDDQASVREDCQPLAVGNVLGNDRDADAGDRLQVGNPGVHRGAYGSLLLGANGDYLYVLDNGSSRVQELGVGEQVRDRFSYQASDGAGTANGQLTVTIHGHNDTPWLRQALPDRRLTRDRDVSWQIPAHSFVDRDRHDTLRYRAQLADGSALPAWLKFDPETRTFSGHVPRKTRGTLAIRVTASDGHGEHSLAADVFRVSFADPGDGCADAGSHPQRRGAAARSGDDPQPTGDDGDDRRGDRPAHASSTDDWLAQWPSNRAQPARRPLDPGLAESWRRSHENEQEPAPAHSDHDFYRRWAEMDATLTRLLAESERLPEWLAPARGADPRAWTVSTREHNPMLHTGGVDAVSLLAGSADLKPFHGLQEGLVERLR